MIVIVMTMMFRYYSEAAEIWVTVLQDREHCGLMANIRLQC